MRGPDMDKYGQFYGDCPMDPLARTVITPELLKLIAKVDKFKGRWEAQGSLAPERLSALRRIATIESVGSSTRIEGVKLRDDEIEKLLLGLDVSSFRSRDEQEVAGYAELMESFVAWMNLGHILRASSPSAEGSARTEDRAGATHGATCTPVRKVPGHHRRAWAGHRARRRGPDQGEPKHNQRPPQQTRGRRQTGQAGPEPRLLTYKCERSSRLLGSAERMVA